MRSLIVGILFVLCLLPAWASNPGEPLDCSDWVFLEPGLSCFMYTMPPCHGDDCEFATRNLEMDNAGAFESPRIL